MAEKIRLRSDHHDESNCLQPSWGPQCFPGDDPPA